MPKNAQTTAQLHSSHTLSKVMLKILQARLQQYVNHELPDIQAGFRKRGTKDQIANIHWIIKKPREFQKNIYFCFTDYAKAFDCVDHNKLENSSRPPPGDLPDPGIKPTSPVSPALQADSLPTETPGQPKIGRASCRERV